MDRRAIEERKQRIIESVKQKLKAYVDKGGILEDLTIKDEEYKAVKNCDIFIDGRRLSVEERFSYFGFPRKPQQKPHTEKLKDIKKILDEFVKEGGDVDELDINHPIYIMMRNFTPLINGVYPSIEEKFKMADHPRHSKYRDMNACIEKLSALENYKDENGYVDSFRKDETMKSYVSYYATMFGFPSSLVVCLLADQKLKSHVVITDRVEFLRTKLTEYLTEHKDFCGIRRLDPQLYHLLTSVSKTYQTDSGRRLTNLEMVEILGFEGINNSFATSSDAAEFSEEAFMYKYLPIIQSNNGKIFTADIESSDYSQLTFYLRRINENKSTFFARYNVEFQNARLIENNKRINLPNYPYLEEMRAELDRFLADIAENHPELQEASAAELFSIKIDIIKRIYDEYKNKIEERYILGSHEPAPREPHKIYS